MSNTNDNTQFKKLYRDIKSDMIQYHCGTSKHFTQKWLKLYASCLRERLRNVKAVEDGAADTDKFISKAGQFDTIPANIPLYRSYIPVYQSEFYRKDSAAYCGFLGAVLKYEDKLLKLV